MEKKKRKKLKKGSKEAKAFMKKLRSLRKKKRTAPKRKRKRASVRRGRRKRSSRKRNPFLQDVVGGIAFGVGAGITERLIMPRLGLSKPNPHGKCAVKDFSIASKASKRNPAKVTTISSRKRSSRAPKELGSRWMEEKIAPAKDFDSKSFRYVRIPRSGKLRAYVLIGCPKGKWSKKTGRCRVGTRAHVVMKVISKSVRRKVAANPLLQTVGLALNPPPRPPFRNGQSVPIQKAWAWINKYGTPELKRQFKKAYELQRKANRAPKYVTWKTLAIGSTKKLDSITALVHYGDTDETMYRAPKGSRKGRHDYLHKWGDGSGRRKPVPILVSADGKTMITPLGPGQKATDWLRG